MPYDTFFTRKTWPRSNIYFVQLFPVPLLSVVCACARAALLMVLFLVYYIRYASARLLKSKHGTEVVMAAVLQNGLALEHASAKQQVRKKKKKKTTCEERRRR